jgi:hypothetical protein
MRFVALLLTLQAVPVKDPHDRRFTEGTGRRCATCHDKTPRAEDMYRAAARMERMTTDLSKDLLKPFGGITCFTCHRGGGPQHNSASPMPLNRSAVRAMATDWPPSASAAAEPMRITMSEYSVSLGVKCEFCHVPGNWKADTKPAMKTTRAMEAVMKEFPKYFNLATASAFTCFTCHQASAKMRRFGE